VDNEDVVDRYFAAMRRGAAAEEDLLSLFDPDAVYSEPFSSLEPAVGIDAIAARFRQGWQTPLPDLQLDVLTIEVDGEAAGATWECRSPALPGPVFGEDRYQIRDGRIVRLDVRLIDPA
jgi:ketosteroid isomerase-like protein